jgi:hypothetical protein
VVSTVPKRKHICPSCGSQNAAQIVYGEPSLNYLDANPVILGGCIVFPDSPTTCCLDCDYRWGGKPKDFFSKMALFKAYVGGYFGPGYSVEVNPVTRTITYDSRDGLYTSDTQKLVLSTETWTKLLRGLASCELADWLDDYTNPDVLDGTNWGVEVVFTYDQNVCKSGSNAYPGRWPQFCRLMSTISGGEFR